MLSTDIECLERWFRGLLSGQTKVTSEQCLAFLDGLEEVKLRAHAIENAAVAEDARVPENPAGANIIRLPLRRKGGRI